MDRILRTLIVPLAFGAIHSALAADFPAKPVRIILPYAPGAAADTVTRAVGQKLTTYWGKQVVIDNRPGVPGMLAGVNATPDGHTLVLGAGSTIVTTPLTMKKPPYDAQKAFVPLSQLVSIPPVLVTNPSLQVKTVKELIATARKRPGELTYASSGGMGAPSHLAMELFMSLTATEMVQVPFKGGSQYVMELMAGRVHLGFSAIPSVLSFLKGGKLTAIGVSSARRTQVLPDVPTVASTVPGFEYDIWYGLFTPTGTPEAIVRKLSADVQRALKEPDVAQLLVGQGAEPAPSSTDEFARYIREDRQRWSKIVTDRNLKIN